jgi:hypothetical protein
MENENFSNRHTEITSSTDEPRTSTGTKASLWKPGQSGNPAGRPKGIKNRITILQQELELQLREQAQPRIAEVLDKAIEMALDGDRAMIKLLLELHMSKRSHQDDESGGKSQVAVVIQNLTDAPVSQPISVKEISNHE